MTNTCAQCGRIYDPEKPHDCANELVELFKMALSERDAALASSPEGVVTLPKLGQRVRITTDDGMDHVGEVIRYGDPEGNVRTLFMVALDDGSSGYFLDEPSWHWTLVPHRPEDTKGGDDEAALARMDALVDFGGES